MAATDKHSRPIRGFFGLVAKEPVSAAEIPPENLEIFRRVYADIYPRICNRTGGEYTVKTEYADIPRAGQSRSSSFVSNARPTGEPGTEDERALALYESLRGGGTISPHVAEQLMGALSKMAGRSSEESNRQ